MHWILYPITSFKAWRDRRYLKRMIKEAKRMSLCENGKQFHVVEIRETKKLKVISNELLKHNNAFKINGIVRRGVALYTTPADDLAKKLDVLKRKKLL